MKWLHFKDKIGNMLGRSPHPFLGSHTRNLWPFYLIIIQECIDFFNHIVDISDPWLQRKLIFKQQNHFSLYICKWSAIPIILYHFLQASGSERIYDLWPSHWRNKSAFLQCRSSVEHCGWQILKIFPQDFCPLVIQLNTSLGTAVRTFVIKATMYLLLNREVVLDYPGGHITWTLQRRRGRQKSQSERCGRGSQEKLDSRGGQRHLKSEKDVTLYCWL